jgi:hypothetical protein
MSFNKNGVHKVITDTYNEKLRVETMNKTGGFIVYKYSSPPICILNGV